MASHTHSRAGADVFPPAPRRRIPVRVVRAWCAFLIAASMAGTAWLMAVGVTGSALVVAATTLVSAGMWAVLHPRRPWRRLPWFALAYVAWAVASLLWTEWPAATLTTLALLLATTAQALFVASVLTGRQIIEAIATAVKWMLGLSVAFELWVSLVWRGPVLPHFVRPGPDFDGDPIMFWSRDKLFTDDRIQGIFGNANSLAYIALLGIVVFGLQLNTRAARRGPLLGWTAVAAFCFWRGSSATAAMCALAIVIVIVVVLLMRRARTARTRRILYVVFTFSGAAIIATLWMLRDDLFELLGRSSDLSGRKEIWATVGARFAESPLIGWGYSVPWVPTDPFFDGWIIDRGVTVMQAHSTWYDVAMQLGVVGLLFFAVALGVFTWRAWFLALGRVPKPGDSPEPRSRLLLIPALVATILLVQSITESSPLLNWGWFLLVMLAFAIKQAPASVRGTPPRRRSTLAAAWPLEGAVSLDSVAAGETRS
ncbi:O-antigen ligase family protein [Microbacterium thalli]|uniref:O-antigen ligase family protein n=1 Tax=Microbacterium thalli TaxID=3027921 RepID=A0ABT5SH74_9MICO|nr:O-antigen ligase family protein [Microbacterium thalli]MDD7962167.1 O-antigen ligase family protein [Microbacterium thalli]MDN8549656.1 O-antigen ligase family protein [Microbacterium thalli]